MEPLQVGDRVKLKNSDDAGTVQDVDKDGDVIYVDWDSGDSDEYDEAELEKI